MNQAQKKPQFKFYPSLLNSFSMYLHEDGFERDGEQIPFVTFSDLIDRINRVEKPISDKALKGIDFEAVICGREAKNGFADEFRIEVIEKFKEYLPSTASEQVYVEHMIDDVLFYGYVDLVGEGRCIDIKTTGSYTFPQYLNNHQNLYLLPLSEYGVKRMDYVITNFSDVFVESYFTDSVSFTKQLNEIELFKKFLIDNRHLITDKKIFAEL